MLTAGCFLSVGKNKMYAMTGKFTIQAGRREALVEILLRASKTVSSLPSAAHMLSMRILPTKHAFGSSRFGMIKSLMTCRSRIIR
jgi:hypothetical protein